MDRLPHNQRYNKHKTRWKRYEKPEHGHRIQVGVKFLESIPCTRKRYYQFTAIDDCMRLRIIRIYERNNQKTAIQFIEYVLSWLSFGTEVIQTDNGTEFQTQIHRHILDKGINQVYIKPRTPRLNDKVKRSHRTDDDEFYRMLDGVVIDDGMLFNDKLKERGDYYSSFYPGWSDTL